MLSDAIREIQKASEVDAQRRRPLAARRDLRRRVDSWIGQVEDLLVNEQTALPGPLYNDIMAFLRTLEPRLQRALQRDPQPVQVLDALFAAQEALQTGQPVPLEISA